MRYELSIILPIPAPAAKEAALAGVHATMHVFELETEAPLATLKQHADKLAGDLGFAGRYTALNVAPKEVA